MQTYGYGGGQSVRRSFLPPSQVVLGAAAALAGGAALATAGALAVTAAAAHHAVSVSSHRLPTSSLLSHCGRGLYYCQSFFGTYSLHVVLWKNTIIGGGVSFRSLAI